MKIWTESSSSCYRYTSLQILPTPKKKPVAASKFMWLLWPDNVVDEVIFVCHFAIYCEIQSSVVASELNVKEVELLVDLLLKGELYILINSTECS